MISHPKLSQKMYTIYIYYIYIYIYYLLHEPECDMAKYFMSRLTFFTKLFSKARGK